MVCAITTVQVKSRMKHWPPFTFVDSSNASLHTLSLLKILLPPFCRFCNKPRFPLCHVKPARKLTETWATRSRNVCAARVMPGGTLTHVRGTAVDLWSAIKITAGTWWVWLAGELGAHAKEDMEYTLIWWRLNIGCKKLLMKIDVSLFSSSWKIIKQL